MQHRFTLQQYKGLSTRFRCPSCQHRNKTFVKYIDSETGNYIADNVGRCNREISCGYHLTPKQYFETNKFQLPRTNFTKPTPKLLQVTSLIPQNIFKQSLSNYHSNNFVQFLLNHFGTGITQQILNDYFIGTSRHWKGATTFWQVDVQGKIRTGKIMLYSLNTGKRIKLPYNHITWVHSALKQPNFNLKQCFFGEHLLKLSNKPVAIVESEKTAIIASVYLPQFIWLAVGSLTNLNEEKCRALKGLKVVLFPDLNAFEKWNCQAKTLKHITSFQVSNFLEINATDEERQNGLDLADYLLRFPLQNFQVKPQVKEEKDMNIDEALIAFDKWWSENPQGGVFEYLQQKFRVSPKI